MLKLASNKYRSVILSHLLFSECQNAVVSASALRKQNCGYNNRSKYFFLRNHSFATLGYCKKFSRVNILIFFLKNFRYSSKKFWQLGFMFSFVESHYKFLIGQLQTGDLIHTLWLNSVLGTNRIQFYHLLAHSAHLMK